MLTHNIKLLSLRDLNVAKKKKINVSVRTQFVTTQNDIGFARKKTQTISFGRA